MELQRQVEAPRSTIDKLRGVAQWWRQETVSRKLDQLMNKVHGSVQDIDGTEVRVEHGQMSQYTTTITQPIGDSFYRTREVVISHEERPFTARRRGFEATISYYTADDTPGLPTLQEFYASQGDPSSNTASFQDVNAVLHQAVAAVNLAQ